MKHCGQATAIGLLVTHVLASVIPSVLGTTKDLPWHIGEDFYLLQTEQGVQVHESRDVIWSAELPFISASGGHDLVVESSGAFNITQVDRNRCQGQTITSGGTIKDSDALDGTGASIAGSLLNCGGAKATYTMTFWVPADHRNRVAFNLTVSHDGSVALNRVYLSFVSNADEDFYGLGAQASFGSLKNQSVPIFSREQGVGRGDQPVTGYENE